MSVCFSTSVMCVSCVAPWLVFAKDAAVQDVWRLSRCEGAELHTAMCSICMESAAVTIAVDRWVDTALAAVDCCENGDLHMCTV